MLMLPPARVPDPKGTGKMIDDYWPVSKSLISDINFLDKLRNYDKDNIQPKIVEKIRKMYLPNPEFTPEKVKSASSAAEGLCKWVRAMENYDKIIKVVKPKQEALAVAQDEYDVVMGRLQEKRAELEEVNRRHTDFAISNDNIRLK